MRDRRVPASFFAAGAALLTTAFFLARCASAPPPGPVPASDAAALAGEWGIEIHLMEHTVEGVLRFTREGSALLGSFTDDEGNQSELEKLHVGDGKIAWQMDRRDGSTLSAKGTIQGTVMSGKMKLKRRDEGDSGFGVSGGGMRGGGGRRVGEPDSFSWTAAKRAESSPSPPPPRP